MEWFKKRENVVFLVLFSLISVGYFCIPLFVTPDSVHYYWYMKIFEGSVPLSSWDVTRGPSFPVIIYLGTLIFGNSMIGILSTTYIFFAGFLFCFYFFVSKTIELKKVDKPKKTLVLALFYVLIMFNPILFGYFHAFLTEFVAIFLALLSPLLCWRWISIDFVKEKVKYLLYVFLLVFLLIFSWFLKQPFVTVVLFPLIISVLLSILMELNWKNIIIRLSTFFFCILFLLAGINGWNALLDYSGRRTQRGYTNEHFLSYSIIYGLSNLRLETQLANIDKAVYLVDESISEEDKLRIQDILEGKSEENFEVVRVMSRKGDFTEKIVLYYEGESFSPKDAMRLWLKIFRRYPLNLLESYFSNYLATANIYISFMDSSGAFYPIKRITDFHSENRSIGLSYTVNDDNFPWIREYQYEPVKDLYYSNDKEIFSSKGFQIYTDFHLNLFKVLFGLLPFVLIAVIAKYLWSFKKLTEEKKRYLNLVIILLGFSFFHTVFHAVTGAIIDRYIYIVVPEIILAFMICFVLIENKRSKVNKKV